MRIVFDAYNADKKYVTYSFSIQKNSSSRKSFIIAASIIESVTRDEIDIRDAAFAPRSSSLE